MATYLAENKQYKLGKPSFRFEQFGLSEKKINADFAGDIDEYSLGVKYQAKN